MNEHASVGSIQKFFCRSFEISGRIIENNEIKIRFKKFKNAVAFDDDVLFPFQNLPDSGHSLMQHPLFSTDPDRLYRSGSQETAGISPPFRILFLLNRVAVLFRAA